MNMTALFFVFLLCWNLSDVGAQEIIEVSEVEKEVIAEELQKEAQSGKHSESTNEFLNKVSETFKNSKEGHEIEVESQKGDCAECSQKKKSKNFFRDFGRQIGKGAAWLTTTTTKPFMTASAFLKGAVEKSDKNKDLVALYQFFLNHQKEFDKLYLQAGTPEEMIEIMLAKMEQIMKKKSQRLMRDFLVSLELKREIPEDLTGFELTAEEIAAIDPSKMNPDFINNHPEYKEIKGLVGLVTKEDLNDIVTSGYFDKAISFDNYKAAVPNVFELAGTIVGQIFAPKIALNIISSTLAGLYSTPVLAANIGTGISSAICLQKETQEKFAADKDLKMFCSYVTNRSGYELLKSRAIGYVAGKKFHNRVSREIEKLKGKRKKKNEEVIQEEKKDIVPKVS
jgi:hypothetical protein